MRSTLVKACFKVLSILFIISLHAGCSGKSSHSDEAPAAEDDVKVETLQASIISPEAVQSIFTGNSLTFEGSSSGGKGQHKYMWWFLGVIPDYEGKGPIEVKFEKAGNFGITLEVTDEDGNVARKTCWVGVEEDLKPTVKIRTSTALPICIGNVVQLSADITGGNEPFSITWDFGNNVSGPNDREDPGAIIYNEAGVYNVSITVKDRSGDIVTDSLQVAVNDCAVNTKPVLTIAPAGSVKINTGDYVTLGSTVTSGNEPLTYLWSCTRDGNSYNEILGPVRDVADPGNITFTTPGRYVFTATVKDRENDSDTKSTVVEVRENTAPAIERITNPLANSQIIAGQTLYLDALLEQYLGENKGNPPLTYFWDMKGAANNLTERAGSVRVTNPGTYGIEFTVTDVDGQSDSGTVNITVLADLMPVAEITNPLGDVSVLQGDESIFYGKGTSGNGGHYLSWSVDEVDAHCYASPFRYRFNSLGRHTVKLTVQDDDADISTATVSVTVNPRPLQASITSPSETVTIDQGGTVNFQASVSGGKTPYVYSWNIDSNPSTVESTVEDPGNWIFYRSGEYNVTLNVTDDLGETSSSSVMVIVNSVPFTAAIDNPSGNVTIDQGDSVNLQATVRGGTPPYTYSWDLNGDPSTVESTQEDPGIRTFVYPGSYDVTLYVTDSEQRQISSGTLTVTVNAVNFEATINNPSGTEITITQGTSIDFQATVRGGTPPYIYSWDLNGDPATVESEVEDPGNRLFTVAGDYNITFRVTDSTLQETTDSLTVHVQPGKTWNKMSAGAYFTVAIASDGTLWAWGANNYGQLGNGTCGDSSSPYSQDSNIPVLISGETDWENVACGLGHALAVKTDGSLWAWGADNYGQLGNGTDATSNINMPVRIGSQDDHWEAIACGAYHSMAIKDDGSLWSWGYNANGQLGLATTTQQAAPVRVGTDTDIWESVSCGGHHTVAVKDDGTMWAWGRNLYGQIGNGESANNQIGPIQISVTADQTWDSVSCGYDYTLAIDDYGQLWAWGINQNGQLGINNKNNQVFPAQVGSEAQWMAVAAGSVHSLALKTDGTIWSWGNNTYGQLGYTATESLIPIKINEAIDWSAVSGGYYHSIARKQDGSLWTWGSNGNGQLGDGTFELRRSPVIVR